MNCELCRIHGRKLRSTHTVVIDGIDYELCYDCMMEHVVTGKGEIATDTYRFWNLMTKMAQKTKEVSL